MLQKYFLRSCSTASTSMKFFLNTPAQNLVSLRPLNSLSTGDNPGKVLRTEPGIKSIQQVFFIISPASL